MSSNTCVFCDRIGAGDVEIVTMDVVTFEPLNPVTEGHRLFVPIRHSPDFLHGGGSHDLGRAMEAAAGWQSRWGNGQDANLIASAGPNSTQTIQHLHIHLVPRRIDDGLTLPWTGQKTVWTTPAGAASS